MEVIPGAAEQRVLAGALIRKFKFSVCSRLQATYQKLDSNPAARKVIFEV